MPTHLILLTLFAAILHASWNALLRGGTDRLWSMAIMCTGVAIVCSLTALSIAPPAKASWIYALLSAILHIGYNLFLVKSYQTGELGQTYPIARGSSPILITIGAFFFAQEQMNISALLGIILVSTGIISLALTNRRILSSSLPYALGTGCFIAAYTVTDGIGSRLSGAPVAYTIWMSMLWGIAMPVIYVCLRGYRHFFVFKPGMITAFTGGLISLLAYGIVIYAMTDAPMGAVSALRETSVLFALVIGYFFLNEKLTLRKILACIVITIGIIIIG